MSTFRRRLFTNTKKDNVSCLIYKTTSPNQRVRLIYMEGVVKYMCLENGENILNTDSPFYTFENAGEHKVFTSLYENVNNLSSCFYYCTSLQSISENLFANNKNVTDFSNCFSRCTSLQSIPENLFANNKNVTDFSNCFSRCTSLTGTTPKDSGGGELWEREGKEGFPISISGPSCFYRCTNLSNYSSIPSDWK